MYAVHGGYYISPESCEQSEWIQAFKRKEDPRTFDKVVRTLDAAIEMEVNDSQNKCRITFTKTGAAVGFNSKQPANDVNHAWDAVLATMGTGRPAIFTMGALYKWRIAVRTEKYWLMRKEETGAVDPLTGEPIVAAEYFISDTFQPGGATKKKTQPEPEAEEPLSAMALALKQAFEGRK